MKIKIEMTVDVDPEAWAGLYDIGLCDIPAAKVREDVRKWAFHTVTALLEENGVTP